MQLHNGSNTLGFAETLPPMTPPDGVWENIQIKLGHKAAHDTEFVDKTANTKPVATM